jgi:peptidyl-prolyl cis-trans isomerase C
MKRSFLVITVLCCSIAAFSVGCKKKDADESGTTDPVESGQPMPAMPVGQMPDAMMDNSPLVTVNGETLKRSTARSMAKGIAARQGVPPQMLQAYMAQAGQQLEQQAVAQFIDKVVLSSEAEKRKIEVTDEETQEVITKLSETLPPDMTIEQALAAQNLTMDKLLADVASNERIRKLYEAETSEIADATDADIEKFYKENTDKFESKESVTAKHILIGCDSKADEKAHATAKAKAEDIKKKLDAGGDFTELAKANSTCPSKSKGGDLGEFPRGQMVPEFDAAAFSQKIGVNGPIVKTQFGYHIIQVTDRSEGGVKSLDEMKERISEHLTGQAKEEVFAAYVAKLRKTAQIAYADGFTPLPTPPQ